MSRTPKTKRMKFFLYIYDLCPDGEGRMTMNDVYRYGEVEVIARLKQHTIEGVTYPIYTFSDRQLNRAIGARGLTWDREDEDILFGLDSKGNVVCELSLVEEN
jgi:hypothetical protein